MNANSSARAVELLSRVARRLRLASLGQRFYLCTLLLSGLYAVILVVGRLAGLTTEILDFRPSTLLAIPAISLLIAFLWHRRPTQVDAARAIDDKVQTKELFLTYALLDKSAGTYQPLVVRDADERAPRVRPQEVVPWYWTARLGRVSIVAAVLLLGVLYLPQLDPFGKVAAAQADQEKKILLQKDKKATELRLADLKKEGEINKETKQVEKSINDMTSSFRKMKRTEKQPNLDKLNDHQKQVGQKWRKLASDKLKTLLSQANSFQDFGGRRQQKLDKWSKELQQGSSRGLEKALDELQQKIQRMKEEPDPVKRSETAKQLKEQLRDMEQFASENVGSPELAAALRRAMRQLESIQRDGTSTEALESLAESLDLTKLELQQLAQSAKNMKALEKALQVLQMAKQLNADEMLDGEACENCRSLSDYAELYAQMMGDREGAGLGGQGIGRGGEAPEDDSVTSDFQTKKEKTAVQAGKVLLSLKSKGLSDSGEAEKDYRQLLGAVKQGVSEAIVQEQIPPGYHEGIRGYFDSIDEDTKQVTDDAK